MRIDRLAEVRKNLLASLGESIAQEQVKREPIWTEGLAVGSPGYLQQIKPLILSRQKTEWVQSEEELWVLQEPAVAYGRFRGPKIGPNQPNRLSDLCMIFVQSDLFWRHQTHNAATAAATQMNACL